MAKNVHFDHVQSELAEMGIVIKRVNVSRIRALKASYEVYPANITNATLRSKLTVRDKDLYKAWEAGKEMVAELAKRYAEYLDNHYNGK